MAALTRRVLVYDSSPGGGGACTSIAALAEPCAEAGVELIVAARQPSAFARLAPALPVHPMPADDLGAIHRFAYTRRELRRAQVLIEIARRVGAEMLLANNAPTSNAAAYLAAARLHLPVVQYVRAQLSLTPLNRALLSRASAILAVGRETFEQLTTVAADRTVRVLEGLSRAQMPSRRASDARGFLWSSALARWKGLQLLLEAYGNAAARCMLPPLDVCYLSMDDRYPDAAPLPQQRPENVRFHHAPVNLDDIRRSCLVYLHTALSPEPFGRSILEAMAAGLCPIVTDEGSGPELVSHMRDGMVVRARDPGQLARALEFVAGRPDLARRLGDAAARKARTFGAEHVFAPVVRALAQSHRRPHSGTRLETAFRWAEEKYAHR